ncbi:MAG: ChaB family protein [Glaciihabitans sp.]|nr:ChaB family protein [Glaciihabitans sp.]
MPTPEEMPDTIRRSPKKARETWSAVHDSAVKSYGEGEQAHRTAFAALKHSFEKVGDHWEPKSQKGPSDEGAERRGGETHGGVNANAPKAHLMQLARRLNVSGRSTMTKDELVDALQKANAKASREAP